MTSMIGSKGPYESQKVGKIGKIRQIPQFTPEQMQLLSSLYPHLGPEGYLQRLAGGDESLFEEIEKPAHRQFSEALGGIASKFSGMGMGARRSSGFGHATTSAAQNFAEQLQSQRQNLKRQALSDLFQYSNTLMGQRPYETVLEEKEPKSGWKDIVGGALPIAGAAVGGYFGGPAGAFAGSQFANIAGSAFTGKPSTANFSGYSELPKTWSSLWS